MSSKKQQQPPLQQQQQQQPAFMSLAPMEVGLKWSTKAVQKTPEPTPYASNLPFSFNWQRWGATLAGLVLCASIVTFLALKDDPVAVVQVAPPTEILLSLSENVLDAAVPLTPTDVVAVGLGEGLAGMVGALASFGLSSLLLNQNQANRIGEKSPARQALADGDFLLARAGLFPLLKAVGLPPALASVASILVATVPYQLVKLGQRKRDLLMEENDELERLLREQQEKAASERKWQFEWSPPKPVSLDTLKPVTQERDSIVVEAFADLTKWLEYDVLSSEFGGELTLMDGMTLSAPVEGALLGIVAAVSSQVYADILYAYFGWGGPAQQAAVLSRSTSQWSAIFISRCLYAATLFGVYEWAQEPAMTWFSALMSGGVDSCVGSEQFSLCIETFVQENPRAVGASWEAEFRALVTSLASIWQRLVIGV
jgi:hypothetical protein